MNGFDQRDLNLVFNDLYKNELDAKTFIIKSQEVQKNEVVDLLRKYGRMPMLGSADHKRNINDICGDGSFLKKKLYNEVPI